MLTHYRSKAFTANPTMHTFLLSSHLVLSSTVCCLLEHNSQLPPLTAAELDQCNLPQVGCMQHSCPVLFPVLQKLQNNTDVRLAKKAGPTSLSHIDDCS